MERTYVLNFIFKMMAGIGIVALLGLAGASDLGAVTNGELFLYGAVAFMASVVGVWGAMNCSRIIAAEKRRQRRQNARLHVVLGNRAA